MGGMFSWLGNSAKNSYDWASKAVGGIAKTGEQFVGKAADFTGQVQGYAGKLSGILGKGYTGVAGQQRQQQQERMQTTGSLIGSEFLANPMNLVAIAGLITVIFLMKK